MFIDFVMMMNINFIDFCFVLIFLISDYSLIEVVMKFRKLRIKLIYIMIRSYFSYDKKSFF